MKFRGSLGNISKDYIVITAKSRTNKFLDAYG
jgi:hypothetical protein